MAWNSGAALAQGGIGTELFGAITGRQQITSGISQALEASGNVITDKSQKWKEWAGF